MTTTLLGIDWGTSNRRAYLIDAAGTCLAEYEDSQGMLAARGRFAEALDQLLAQMQIAPEVPLLLSGMVGSASGWQEVPYLDTGVALEQLPRHAVPVAAPAYMARPGRVAIVPGYCYRNEHAIDVMRGEETQLLGAVALGRRDGWLVLPGTHSKWVLLKDGVVERLATYMTGELFAMLSAGGTLSAMMDGDRADPDAFGAGLRQARLREPLSNSLFRVRARVVAGAMPAAHAAAFVSGLLIGAEFAAAGDLLGTAGNTGITVIGSPALAERYAAAAAHFNLPCQVLDPHQVYCAALARFI